MTAISPSEIQALAASQSIKAQQIDPDVWQMQVKDSAGNPVTRLAECEGGGVELVEIVQWAAMDDMGDYMEAQELDKALAAGKLQAGMGGV